jgi:hypothetical protein
MREIPIQPCCWELKISPVDASWTGKGDLLRIQQTLVIEKDVLLKELEHRVSNSLQIIAAIILMKSTWVTSEECIRTPTNVSCPLQPSSNDEIQGGAAPESGRYTAPLARPPELEPTLQPAKWLGPARRPRQIVEFDSHCLQRFAAPAVSMGVEDALNPLRRGELGHKRRINDVSGGGSFRRKAAMACPFPRSHSPKATHTPPGARSSSSARWCAVSASDHAS